MARSARGNGKIYWVSKKEGKAMGIKAFLLAHPLYKSPAKSTAAQSAAEVGSLGQGTVEVGAEVGLFF